MPYLVFDGCCEEAFNFYKSVFGGNFHYVGRYGDLPIKLTKFLNTTAEQKIMHISLPIAGNTVLVGSDRLSRSHYLKCDR